MTNETPVQPEFGPNGAVMNAPTMTPQLRSDYVRESSFWRSLLGTWPFLLFLLVLIGIRVIFDPPFSGLWIGIFAGVFGVRLFDVATKHRRRR